MTKLTKDIALSTHYRLHPKVDQVIYISSPINMPNITAQAQIVFKIPCGPAKSLCQKLRRTI